MAEIQTIQVKRGQSENLSKVTLAAGEPALTTDDGKLYFGVGEGNKILINPDIMVDEGLNKETSEGAITLKLGVIGEAISLGWIEVDKNGRVTKLESVTSDDISGLLVNGKIAPSLIPKLAITETHVVGDEAEMLALETETGDVAIRNDIDKNFILQGDDPTDIDHWVELRTPNSVTKEDLGLENVTNESKETMFTDPIFTGEAKAETPDTEDNSARIATTEFVNKLLEEKNYITEDDIVLIDGGTF